MTGCRCLGLGRKGSPGLGERSERTWGARADRGPKRDPADEPV